MSYSVVTTGGDRVGDKDGATLREYLSEQRQHAMVRMANQSIFADMLEASLVGTHPGPLSRPRQHSS